jgi:hypothetical protein
MIFGETNLFTWNDLVIIKSNAPSHYYPGKIGVVCGMEQIKSEKLSNEFNVKMGDWLYTVEFGDGTSIEVPEYYLEKHQMYH